MTLRPIALIALASLGLSGCVVATTETRTWDDPYAESGPGRRGRVDRVREVIQRQHGDPAGGAIAGAIIGGIIGGTLGGHYGRHGYYHPSGAGTLVGAAGGAAIGAAASQGGSEDIWYEVYVRFDDGGYETFTYRGGSPFRPGDEVYLGPRGLALAR